MPANDSNRDGSESKGSAERLSRYEFVDRLGSGQSALCYLARQYGNEGFERLVAIKKIRAHLARQTPFIETLQAELEKVAMLDHPAILEVYEVGHEDRTHFIAIEYLAGQPLSAVIAAGETKKRPINIYDAARIVADAADGLDAAHNLTAPDRSPVELIHRDIHPGNIMVLYDGGVKLVGFGFAKARRSMDAVAARLLKWTVGYAAPEQIDASTVDSRADVFALGVVLWEALARRRLYSAEDRAASLELIRSQSPDPPSKFRAEIPKELDAICLRALAVDPADRFQSARAVRIELENFLWTANYARESQSISKYMSAVFPEAIQHQQALVRHAITHRSRDLKAAAGAAVDAARAGHLGDEAASDGDNGRQQLPLPAPRQTGQVPILQMATGPEGARAPGHERLGTVDEEAVTGVKDPLDLLGNEVEEAPTSVHSTPDAMDEEVLIIDDVEEEDGDTAVRDEVEAIQAAAEETAVLADDSELEETEILDRADLEKRAESLDEAEVAEPTAIVEESAVIDETEIDEQTAVIDDADLLDVHTDVPASPEEAAAAAAARAAADKIAPPPTPSAATSKAAAAKARPAPPKTPPAKPAPKKAAAPDKAATEKHAAEPDKTKARLYKPPAAADAKTARPDKTKARLYKPPVVASKEPAKVPPAAAKTAKPAKTMMGVAPANAADADKAKHKSAEQPPVAKPEAKKDAKPDHSDAKKDAKPDQSEAKKDAKPDRPDAKKLAKPDKPAAKKLAKPGEPDAKKDAKKDQPDAKTDAKPGKPDAKKDAKKDAKPDAKKDAKPGQPDAKKDAKPGQPDAKKDAKPGQPDAKKDAKPGQPDAKKDAKPDQPDAKKDAKPDQPDAKKDAKPDQPDAKKDAKPDGAEANESKPGQEPDKSDAKAPIAAAVPAPYPPVLQPSEGQPDRRKLYWGIGGVAVLLIVVVVALGSGGDDDKGQRQGKSTGSDGSTTAGGLASVSVADAAVVDNWPIDAGSAAAGDPSDAAAPDATPAVAALPPDAAPAVAALPPDAAPAVAIKKPPRNRNPDRTTNRDKNRNLDRDKNRNLDREEDKAKRREAARAKAKELYKQGLRHFIQGKTDAARKAFLSATKADPSYAPAYRGLGLAYERANDKRRAIKALKKYLSLSPKAPDAASIRKRIKGLGG